MVDAHRGGIRESEQSWLELLVDLKRRGLQTPPELAVGGTVSKIPDQKTA